MLIIFFYFITYHIRWDLCGSMVFACCSSLLRLVPLCDLLNVNRLVDALSVEVEVSGCAFSGISHIAAIDIGFRASFRLMVGRLREASAVRIGSKKQEQAQKLSSPLACHCEPEAMCGADWVEPAIFFGGMGAIRV